MYKPFDILVVGELNVDVILNQLEGFPALGKEIFAQRMDVVLGSSSAIFASNAASLNMKVAYAGKVGNDAYGKFILDQLNRRFIDTRGVIVADNEATGATLVLNYGNDRAMVTYPGAMSHFGLEDIDSALIGQARHLHVSSVFLQPALRPGLITLFQKARQAGLSTSLDPQWDPAEKWDIPWHELLPLVDYFLPNAAEIQAITHTFNVLEALKKVEWKPCRVIVKDGIRGAWLNVGGEVVHQPAFVNAEVVDAIGAGDSFDAGFIAGILSGLQVKDSLRLASLCGAINTTAAGGTAAFASLDEVRKTALTRFATPFPL